MALATETKAIPAYSPTSTPILDGLRPAPQGPGGKLTAGGYFFLSSLLILTLIALPSLRQVVTSLASAAWGFSIVLVLALSAALLAAFLVHEMGHILAAWAAGFRLPGISVAAYSSRQKLHAGEVLRAGLLVLEPRKTSHLRRRLLLVFLGGPVTGLLFALAVELCRNWAQAGVITQMRVHLVAAFSVIVSLASLLPDTNRRGRFSDGARLVMLLKNDERTRRWFAIIELQLALNNGRHPRDWDPSLVFRATAINDESRDGVMANWLAYLWASERQDITSATKYLEDALAAPAACSAWLRERLFLEAAVFQAWFRDNPANARSWAALIHENKLAIWERRRLQIALLWADGRLFDAFETMPAYFQSLHEMPATPARDLAQQSATEWKRQMESRMLTRAWRAMYTMSQNAELADSRAVSSSSGKQLSSC
jgi:hypothetical protein